MADKDYALPPIKRVTRKEGEKRVIRIPPPSPLRGEREKPSSTSKGQNGDYLENAVEMYETALTEAREHLYWYPEGVTYDALVRLINDHMIELHHLLEWLYEQ